MSFKVRPFQATVDDEFVEGVITGNHFVCCFYGRRFEVSATAIGRDEISPFALIEETDRPEAFGYRFKVDADGSGCCICLFRDKSELLRMIARENGVDPGSVNLVGPGDESICIYFSSQGKQEGSSRSEPEYRTLSDQTM